MTALWAYFLQSTRVRWADPHGAGPLGFLLGAVLLCLTFAVLSGIAARRGSRRACLRLAVLGAVAVVGTATAGMVRLWFDLATTVAGIAELGLERGGQLLVLGPGVPVGLPGPHVALVRSAGMPGSALASWLCAGNRLVVARISTLDATVPEWRMQAVWEGAGVGIVGCDEAWYWRRPLLTWVGPTEAELLWETPDPEVGVVQVRSGKRRSSVVREDVARKVHRVTLGGLEPSTVYHYAVRGSAVPDERSGDFRTLPAPGSESPVRFAVIGDSGGGRPVTRKLVREIVDFAPDFVLHVGDLAYDRATRASLFAQYYETFSGLADRVPVWVVPGNHDVFDGGRDLAIFLGEDPDSPAAASYQRFLRAGGLAVGSVNSNAPPLPLTGARRAFATEMKKSDPRPWWRIAFFHHPPFAGEGRGRNDEVYLILHPLLVSSHVDVAFCGHSHNFQRSAPLGLWKPRETGVRYVVTGGGGGTLREAEELPEVEVRSTTHHFMRAVAAGGKLWLEARDDSGTVLDRVVLARDDPDSPVREEGWSEPPADLGPHLPIRTFDDAEGD